MEKIKNFLPINFDLLSNPVNWIVVVLMVMIAGISFSLLTSFSNTDGE